MNNHLKVPILLFVMIILASCQPFAFESSGTSTYSTPTPSWGVQTKDAEYLRPALFTAEDLNWEVGTYREMTAGLNVDITFNEGVFVANDVMGALIDIPISIWAGGGSWGASQNVKLYANEEIAIHVGELERDRSARIGIIGTENTDPRLNIVAESCWGASGAEGEYQNCNFWGQHGRYVMLAHMTVDGESFTMDDWVAFLDVIQDRLIAQVENENAAGNGE